MNKLRGAAELEVCGQKRYVKFGTNQTAIFCQVQECDINEVGELLSPEKLQKNQVRPQVLINFCYAAFAAGYHAAKKEIDFDVFDIGDWMDEEPNLIVEVLKIAEGANSPNGNRAQRRATKS